MDAKLVRPIRAILLTFSLVAITVPILFVVLFLLFLKFFALRDADTIHYYNGLMISSTMGEDSYRRVSWHATNYENPEPCPLTIHLQSGDLHPDALSSQDTMEAKGWTEEKNSPRGQNIILAKNHVICSFVNKKLTMIQVYAERGDPPQKVAITISGKRIDLPATKATIVQVLGPPTG